MEKPEWFHPLEIIQSSLLMKVGEMKKKTLSKISKVQA